MPSSKTTLAPKSARCTAIGEFVGPIVWGSFPNSKTPEEANALGAQLHDSETEKPKGEDTPVQISEPVLYHDSPKTPPTHTPTTSSAKPTATRAGIVATSVARFGNSLSRIFRNKFYDQVDKSPMSVDSRLQREIEAKKKGQNLSM